MTKHVLEQLYEQYFQMVYRICFLYMKQEDDALDMVQDTFVKLYENGSRIFDEKNIKAWLIVTASNTCKSQLRKFWRKKRVDFDEEYFDVKTYEDFESNDILSLILSLDKKYQLVTYLYYFEQYTTGEIGELLKISPSTVQTRLAKARELLKAELL